MTKEIIKAILEAYRTSLKFTYEDDYKCQIKREASFEIQEILVDYIELDEEPKRTT